MKKKLLIVLAIILLLGIMPAFATNVIKDRNLKGYLNSFYMRPSRPADTPITKEDLKTLTHYRSPSSLSKYVNIYSFEGMQYAVNLTSLNLFVDHMNDYYIQRYHFNLGPFTGLKKLKSLSFGNVNISDQNLIDIGKIKSLTDLQISGGAHWRERGVSYPTTLSGLANLTNLTKLELYIDNNKKNGININAIKNLKKLESLGLGLSFTKNYEVLRNKPELKNLYIRLYGIKDLRVFKGLIDFEKIRSLIHGRNALIGISADSPQVNRVEGNNIYLDSPYKYKSDYIDIDGTPIQKFTFDKNKVSYEGNGVYKLKDGVKRARMAAKSKNDKIEIEFYLYRGKHISNFTTERIEGSSRFQTALKISDKLYTNANTAIIVNANKFPDALTSTVLSKKLKAPILLSGRNEIPESVNLKMKKLGVKNVVIVGGNLVISDKLERQLKTNYKVRRIGGRSRYETSELVANEIGGNGVVVARGDHFADALTISSFALSRNYPIYLTKPNSLSNSTFEKIKRRKPVGIIIAGGNMAISKGVENKLKRLNGGRVMRIGGATRFETATKIAVYSSSKAGSDVMIARSDDFADAMVAGPLAHKLGAPILLVARHGVENYVKKHLKYYRPNINKAYIIGGTVAVPTIIETELKNIMK